MSLSFKRMSEALADTKRPRILTAQAQHPFEGCFEIPVSFLLNKDLVHSVSVCGPYFGWINIDDRPQPWTVGVTWERFCEEMLHTDRYKEWESFDLEDYSYSGNPNTMNQMTAICRNFGVPEPIWECELCEKEKRGFAKFLSYHGAGGISVFVDMPCCPECFETHRYCGHCFKMVVPKDGACPNCELEEDEEQELYELEDEGKNFGCDGMTYLTGAAGAGYHNVAIVTMQKGVANG